MHNSEDYFLLGTLSKTHGVHGEFVLKLNNIDADDIEEMESVFIEFDGLLVPFFISEFFQKSAESLIIKFEDIETEEQASEFVSCKVFTQNHVAPPKDSFISIAESIMDYQVIDLKVWDISG
ncbi:MAG: hypothetical protein HC906_07985 [Bacteroidales bacterium]|nr:hypothetical protein [Bacteroidales bacterium]